jgi:thiamine kinase-like enzyme
LALAADLLDRRQQAQVRAHLHALADLGPLPTTSCHLDFTPGNLLRDDDGQVNLIDFEHARRDLPARDLVRLATRVWPARP